jgi:hypothetical protein
MRWIPKFNPKSGLRLILLLQLGLAGILILSDASSSFPAILRPPVELPTGPVSPGDQRREYRIDRPNPRLLTPARPSELPLPELFSDRLQFTEANVPGIGDVILVSGRIGVGDSERFTSFLEGMPARPQMVALHSPGGIVQEALKIGRRIRNEGLTSGVLSGAYCMSSCPYLLAGGLERTVSLNAIVGVHQHYYEQPKLLPVVFAVEQIQSAQGETMEFLIEMGVDPSLMVYSLKTPPEQIYALVKSELAETRIATNIIE